MKKFLSMLLALTFLVGMAPMMPIKATETVAADNEVDDIQGFVNESKALLACETEPIFTTSSVDEEDTGIDFSSCRLILKATKKPDKLNSVGIADGFKDYYIVQFENEIDTKKAYEYYSEKEYVTSVGVDEKQNALTSVELDNDIDFNNLNSSSNLMAADVPTYDGVPDRLNSWGSEAIGAYAVKDYINNSIDIEKSKVTVAVIDTGIDKTHDYFSNKLNRLEKTDFTTVNDKSKDETDFYGHGTAVTSVILDSTPDNVVVRNYKVTDDGYISMTDASVAILQAVIDGADIINCSFAIYTMNKMYTGYYLFEDCLKETYEENTLVVCSAGNKNAESIQPAITLPATSDYTLNVSGLSAQFRVAFCPGWSVDVTAPAVDMPVAYKGSYAYLSGTSFSSPLTASVCASMLTLDLKLTPEEFIDQIKETATPYDDYSDLNGISNLYGAGIVDAIEATGIVRPQKVVANLDGGKYENEINLTFTAPDGGDVYYTTNGTYPTPQNGKLYTKPITIYANDELFFATTYDENGIPSRLFSDSYRSSILEDESKFEIDENGTITEYNGNLLDIIIPETINGIEVKNIAYSTFKDKIIIGLTLPKRITKLGYFDYDYTGSFFEHQYLMFIDGDFVEEIGHDVFNNCNQLVFVNFPNCKKLGDGTFSNLETIKQLKFPLVENIGVEAFMGSYIYNLYLPKLKSCAAFAFASGVFCNLYAPKFAFIDDDENINYPHVLYKTALWSPLDWQNVEDLRLSLFGSNDVGQTLYRVEFSNLKALYDMPSYSSTLALPSTLEILPETFKEENGSYFNSYKIYGSKDTLVEEWAIEHDLNFIEVTPETAVVTDLPKYYKSYMGNLMADVVGFNKKYQWYANNVNSNEGGTPIDGATDMYFNPATYPDAKYYYCEVISQDVGYEPITIKTSACENRIEKPAVEKSSVTNVTYEPSKDTHTIFTVTVNDRPTQIQFIEPSGGTRTYDRNHKNVTVKSYDENGNEVSSLSRILEYEVWEIYSNMATDVEIRTRAKYLKENNYTWEKEKYSFTVELLPPDGAVRSVTPAATSGRIGAVETVVVTGPDAEAIRFVMPNGTTATYAASKATALANGDLQFVGKAWMNNVGTNTITVQVKVNGKWQTAATFTYTADDYPVSA